MSWEAPSGIMQINNGDSEKAGCKGVWNDFNSGWYLTEGEQRSTLFEELDGEYQAGRAGFSRFTKSK